MNTKTTLLPDASNGFVQVVGVGGIGSGRIIALEGDHTLGREESRLGAMLNARDYCKLHIVEHYIAKLMGSSGSSNSFRVFAIGNVGDDGIGTALIREMAAAGITTEQVRVLPGVPTLFSVCFLYPDGAGGNITTSNSAASALDARDVERGRSLLEAAGPRGIALCLPEVPLEARRDFLRMATDCGSYRVASFASGDIIGAKTMGLLSQVDLLALNRDEAQAIAGKWERDEQLLEACAAQLSANERRMRIVVTVGASGAYAFENSRWTKHSAIPTEVVSTAGAGDALLAGVIAALSAGLPFRSEDPSTTVRPRIECAIDFGLLVAAFSVTSPHTIHPDAELASVLEFAAQRDLTPGARFLQVCSLNSKLSPNPTV
ncbi:MAG: carbohydrate kinase family protein [Terriglobales bacterium]